MKAVTFGILGIVLGLGTPPASQAQDLATQKKDLNTFVSSLLSAQNDHPSSCRQSVHDLTAEMEEQSDAVLAQSAMRRVELRRKSRQNKVSPIVVKGLSALYLIGGTGIMTQNILSDSLDE